MNPVDRISFVVATHRPQVFARTREYLIRLGAGDIVAVEHASSIFAAYDAGRREARREALCFLHEDVDVEGLDAELILARLADPRTGFLGVAGSRVLDESGVWWHGLHTPEQAARLSGRCGHRDGDRRWVNQYGDFGDVVVLDGVCLFTTRGVIDAIGGFADPPLGGFDYYDISATFRAHLCGFVNTTIPVDLFHWGREGFRPGWEANRRRFQAKYAAHLPRAVPGVAIRPVGTKVSAAPARPTTSADPDPSPDPAVPEGVAEHRPNVGAKDFSPLDRHAQSDLRHPQPPFGYRPHSAPSLRPKRVLHVGCGFKHPAALHETFHGEGWEELRLDIDPVVEPDIVASIVAMPEVPDAAFDAVWSSHNLEHLFAHEVPLALAEFRRVLRPGGFALITMPDLQAVAEHIAEGRLEEPLYDSPAGPITALDMCYGLRTSIARGRHQMAHRTGFTAGTLAAKLADAGFERIRVERDGFALWAEAYKPRVEAARDGA